MKAITGYLARRWNDATLTDLGTLAVRVRGLTMFESKVQFMEMRQDLGQNVVLNVDRDSVVEVKYLPPIGNRTLAGWSVADYVAGMLSGFGVVLIYELLKRFVS